MKMENTKKQIEKIRKHSFKGMRIGTSLLILAILISSFSMALKFLLLAIVILVISFLMFVGADA